MKVEYAESNVLGSGGLGQSQSFQIRTNAHAFKMLSSGLYSDKVGAVLREIGCNAHDAHISAGIAHTPIEVKLPNGVDDQFWIKDKGPGLSYDEVMNLYTTYFASTKQDSNDFTGGFGLGSKSPFSYTDSFLITACHGGKERIFTAHIGNDGSPKIAMMGERDATETGIKISFSVPKDDFSEFQTKAQQIYQYFNPLPTILGGDDIKPLKVIRDFGRYAVTDPPHARSGGNSELRVKMGNVVYPINYNQLTKTSNRFAYAFRYSSGFLFKMPIGSLMVAASREELQYDPATVMAIIKEMEHVVRDVCTTLETEYSKITGWKERCKFHELYQQVRYGIDITHDLMKDVGVVDHELLYTACRSSYIGIPRTSMHPDIVVATCEGKQLSSTYRMTKGTIGEYSDSLSVALDVDMVLIHGNVTKAAERLRKALKDGKHQKILTAYPAIGKTVAQADLDKVVANILKVTGPIDTVDLATLDYPAVVKMTRAKLAAGQFPDGDVYTTTEIDKVIKASTVLPEHRVYIRVRPNRRWGHDNPTIWFAGREMMMWEWSDKIRPLSLLNKHADIKAPVYITYAQMKSMRIEKDPSWTLYEDYLKAALVDKKLLAKLRKEVKDYVPSVALGYAAHEPLECLVKVKNDLPKVYNKIVPSLRRIGIYKEIEKVHAVSSVPGVKTKTPDLISAFREFVKLISGDMSIVPSLDKTESVVNSKLSPKFRQLNSTFLATVAELSEKACVTLLTEALS